MSGKNFILIIVFLTMIGFALRLINFTNYYRIDQGDVARDYLVAHHIVNYKEFPTVGPYNSIFSSVRNSPLYFYFLSLPLFIYDDIYTLGYFNVLLQFLSMLMLCALAKNLFGTKVALVSYLLLIISPEYFYHTSLMWQPFASEFFLCASYLLLTRGYIDKSYRSIMWSVLIFLLSLGMGFYALGVLPFYALIIYITLRKSKTTPTGYVWLLVMIIIVGSAEYWSVVKDFFIQARQQERVFQELYVVSISQYLYRFYLTSKLYLEMVMGIVWMPSVARFIALFSFIILVPYYILHAKKKEFAGALFLMIIQMICLLSFINKQVYVHYFIAGLGIFYIFLAEIAVHAFALGKYQSILRIGTILLFFLGTVVSPNLFRYRRELHIQQDHEAATRALLQEVYALQKINSIPDTEDFKIVTYNSNRRTNAEAIFWVPLEKALGKKLTTVSPWYNNYVPMFLDSPNIFLTCLDFDSYQEVHDVCLQKFYNDYPKSRLVKTVFTGGRYHIFLTERS